MNDNNNDNDKVVILRHVSKWLKALAFVFFPLSSLCKGRQGVSLT